MADKWRYARVINCPTNINKSFVAAIIHFGLPVKRKHALPINHAATKLFVKQANLRWDNMKLFLTPFVSCQNIPLREDVEKPFPLIGSQKQKKYLMSVSIRSTQKF